MTTTIRVLQPFLRSTSAFRRYFSAIPGLERYLEPRDVELPDDFRFFPEFLDEEEQRVLLANALRQLDNNGSRAARRILKREFRNKNIYDTNTPTVRDLFLPEESGCYDFEEGHYDGVIQHYREMHVTSWPVDPALESVLRRLRSLLPSTLAEHDIQPHILHLSSKGIISPHIDNVGASGSWIAAISLGHERVLRMEALGKTPFEILLPSGSAYVQKDTVRYSYQHSIPGATNFKGRVITPGQRISIVLRDRPRSESP